jgi:hypothetical protein
LSLSSTSWVKVSSFTAVAIRAFLSLGKKAGSPASPNEND